MSISVKPRPSPSASSVLNSSHQIALQTRPNRVPAMNHIWRHLLFLHFPVDPKLLQPLIPAGLEIDVFPDESGREMAWVGLVLFSIDQITFGSHLRIPTADHFLETNVRTYVHHKGKDPAVLFLSLDAESRLVCAGARATFGLSYWHARMALEANDSVWSYSGSRSNGKAAYRVRAEIGERMAAPQPDTLEFFLAERYLLYSVRFGHLVCGRVHHVPYELHRASCLSCEQSLTDALGIKGKPITHAMFCLGVSSEVFAPQAVTGYIFTTA